MKVRGWGHECVRTKDGLFHVPQRPALAAPPRRVGLPWVHLPSLEWAPACRLPWLRCLGASGAAAALTKARLFLKKNYL